MQEKWEDMQWHIREETEQQTEREHEREQMKEQRRQEWREQLEWERKASEDRIRERKDDWDLQSENRAKERESERENLHKQRESQRDRIRSPSGSASPERVVVAEGNSSIPQLKRNEMIRN
jgi:hypothetical protein